jgi:hypothetical protein
VLIPVLALFILGEAVMLVVAITERHWPIVVMAAGFIVGFGLIILGQVRMRRREAEDRPDDMTCEL